MSKIYVDEIAGIASADTVAIPGHVIQVVQTVDGTKRNYSLASTFSDHSDLDTNITPSATSSKVLVKVSMTFGMDVSNNAYAGFRLLRDDAVIDGAIGPSTGSRVRVSGAAGETGNSNANMQNVVLEYLDSPSSTSQLTYSVQVTGYDSRTFTVNATGASDSASGRIAVSSITLMEIAG